MKVHNFQFPQRLCKLFLIAVSTLVASCAVPQVVQPSARDLPLSRVAVITTPPIRYQDKLYAAVKTILDADGKKVVSFGMSANMHNSVVVIPGTYDITLHCFNDTGGGTADPSAKVDFRAGYTYLLHCLLDGAIVSVHVDAVATQASP